jgi:hypothetical protein
LVQPILRVALGAISHLNAQSPPRKSRGQAECEIISFDIERLDSSTPAKIIGLTPFDRAAFSACDD